jgi:hypothetical protein
MEQKNAFPVQQGRRKTKIMLDNKTENIIDDIEQSKYNTLAQLIEQVGEDCQNLNILAVSWHALSFIYW